MTCKRQVRFVIFLVVYYVGQASLLLPRVTYCCWWANSPTVVGELSVVQLTLYQTNISLVQLLGNYFSKMQKTFLARRRRRRHRRVMIMSKSKIICSIAKCTLVHNIGRSLVGSRQVASIAKCTLVHNEGRSLVLLNVHWCTMQVGRQVESVQIVVHNLSILFPCRKRVLLSLSLVTSYLVLKTILVCPFSL